MIEVEGKPLKVTDVKMEVYRWPRHKPIRNGRYTYPTSGLNVVKIETDEGVTGIGYSGGVQGAEEISISRRHRHMGYQGQGREPTGP